MIQPIRQTKANIFTVHHLVQQN